jgi:pheromone shutdown protein TraB
MDPSNLISPLNNVKDINHQIFFLGTMHIAESSAQKVAAVIQQIKPHIVMVELDAMRFQELQKKATQTAKPIESKPSITTKSESKSKNTGYLEYLNSTDTQINTYRPYTTLGTSQPNLSPKNDFFTLLGTLQQELGQVFKITPGAEMLSAVTTAEQMHIPIVFIDRPIIETFARMQELGEQVKAEQDHMTQQMEEEPFTMEDLQKMIEELKDPENIREMIQEFEKNYPQLFQILIQERNEYMADQILTYNHQHPNYSILVITGAGHTDDLLRTVQQELQQKSK